MLFREEDNMFKDTIKGLDKVFETDITQPKVILITGPPGSMKTTFAYAIMNKYVENTGKFGLLATLEETVESHLKSIESIGIRVCHKKRGCIQLL